MRESVLPFALIVGSIGEQVVETEFGALALWDMR